MTGNHPTTRGFAERKIAQDAGDARYAQSASALLVRTLEIDRNLVRDTASGPALAGRIASCGGRLLAVMESTVLGIRMTRTGA